MDFASKEWNFNHFQFIFLSQRVYWDNFFSVLRIEQENVESGFTENNLYTEKGPEFVLERGLSLYWGKIWS